MEVSIIIPLIIFAVSMSITPGPNNIMLTASGANFGFVKTIPHILGIVFGIALLNLLSAVGLNRVFQSFPIIEKILKIAGVTYLLYLAVKIVRTDSIKEGRESNKPLNFFQAMLFQALNPKAVLMTITGITLYASQGESYMRSVLTVIIIFFVCGVLSISVWALFGTFIRKILQNSKNLKVFNYSMGTLCGLSAILIIM